MRILWVGLVFAMAAWGAASSDDRAAGHDHYFNLEYDEAIAAYERVLAREPDDPSIHNHLATAILYKELNRLGMLETSAFKGDNQFLDRIKLQPDPSVKREIFDYLDRGRALADKRIRAMPSDRAALFSLSHNYALRANYQFMVEKSYFGALRNGNRARRFSNRLQRHHPDFVDAVLVAGVQEYVVGSLPWAVRAMIAFGGVRGNKKNGEAMVERVAREGNFVRNEARALLVLLHRREGRPLEAVKILESYLRDFPRNYVLQLEMAAMYLDAGQKVNALKVFRDVQRKYEADEQRFGRMPSRLLKAVERRIKKLAGEVENSRVQLAYFAGGW